MASLSIVPWYSLLTRCPHEVWEREGERTASSEVTSEVLGESLSVTSQLKVESRTDRAKNT